MTTAPVMSITDELIAELDALANANHAYVPVHPPVMRALLAERAELIKDRERLDQLDKLGYAYGFQDVHEGNRWEIDGPFSNVRSALDAAIDTAMEQQQ